MLPALKAEPAVRQERTIRPLPIALAVAGIVVAAVTTAAILTAAAGSTPTAAPSSAVPAPPIVTPAASPAAPAGPVVVPPKGAPGPNECLDSTGEGGAVDLQSASVAVEKGDLVARFQLVQPLPKGAASLGIFAESRNGQVSYQLAATWKDGTLTGFVEHDFARNRDTRLDPRGVESDGSKVTAVFPGDILTRLGTGWRWYAFSTAGGKDADACPGDPLSFDTLAFDSQSTGNSH